MHVCRTAQRDRVKDLVHHLARAGGAHNVAELDLERISTCNRRAKDNGVHRVFHHLAADGAAGKLSLRRRVRLDSLRNSRVQSFDLHGKVPVLNFRTGEASGQVLLARVGEEEGLPKRRNSKSTLHSAA
eukprot:6212740-Pleurochrysis_carterae.AAC.2